MRRYFVTIRNRYFWPVWGDHFEAASPGEATRAAWAAFMTPIGADELAAMSPDNRAIAVELERRCAETRAEEGLHMVVRASRAKG